MISDYDESAALETQRPPFTPKDEQWSIPTSKRDLRIQSCSQTQKAQISYTSEI